MPTLFDTIENVFSSSNISASLGSQIGSLGGIITTVEGLITNPPDSFGGFVTKIAETAPDLNIAGDLGGSLAAISNAVPGDISGMLAPLTGALGQVEGSTGLDLTTGIGKILEAVQAITRLLETDFTFGLNIHSSPADSGTTSAATSSGASTPSPSGSGSGADSLAAASTPTTGLTNAAEGTARTKAMLDSLPSPLTIPNLLNWILGHIQTQSTFLPTIPVLDELREPLDALIRWNGLETSAILDEFAATLNAAGELIHTRLNTVLHTPLAKLGELSGQFQGEALTGLTNDMVTALTTIKTATDSGSLAGATATINNLAAALDSYDALRAAFDTNVQTTLNALSTQISSLPDALDAALSYLCTVLSPSGGLGDLAPDTTVPGLPAEAETLFTELETRLKTYLGYFKNLLDVLDISVIQEPLQTVAESAGSALDAVDSALTMLGSSVQDIFSGVESALAAVDPAAITTQVTGAITDFKNNLLAQINEAFAPVREALSQVVDSINSAVGAFDPNLIKNELESLLAELTGVFTGGDIKSALESIREALETTAAQVEQLSFTPVVDEVCTGIDSVKNALSQIDPDQLSTALKMALAGAMAVLPSELTPVTDPLVSGFGDLIDQGPVPLLDEVKDLPTQLFDKLRDFEPQNLIGDALSKPFGQLIEKMDGFTPSKLLDKVDEGFDTLKNRLKQNAGPDAAFTPLYAFQNTLAGNFAKIHPDELLKPVEEQIQQVMQRVKSCLPVDEIFSVLDKIIAQVQGVAGLGDGVLALANRLNEILSALSDGKTQLETWIDGILDKISGDIGVITPALNALTSSIDAARAEALKNAFQSAATPLITQLAAINPEGLLTAVYNACHAITQSQIEALPASSAKTLLVNTLARIEQQTFKSVFVALATIKKALTDAQAGMTARMQGWDNLYHAQGTILHSLHAGAESVDALKGWIHDDIMHHLAKPLNFLFAFSAPAARLIQAFTGALTSVLTEIRDKITALVDGPGSLGAVRDAIQALVDRITNINLDFLTASLNEAYETVKSKIDALKTSLDDLKETLSQAFEDMLDALSVSSAIPAGSLATLDTDYTAILNALKNNSPDEIIVKPLQKTYEETVLPMIESFDFGPLIQSLVDKLKALEAGLGPDVDRVNAAYQEMLDAAPDVSVGLSDIGGALGF